LENIDGSSIKGLENPTPHVNVTEFNNQREPEEILAE
jgi:hypothetical protein